MQTSGLPSGWEIYYVVFLSALVALGIPLILGGVSWIFARRARVDQSNSSDFQLSSSPVPTVAPLPMGPGAPSASSSLGRRINTRFFLSANAALVLITLALVLIPYASVLHGGTAAEGADLAARRTVMIRGLISVVTISGLAALALLYAARKGDLNWLQTFRSPEDKS